MAMGRGRPEQGMATGRGAGSARIGRPGSVGRWGRRRDGEFRGREPHRSCAGAFRELNPNEMLARNTPKFEVERKEEDTRVEIYYAAKPGLLLSTVSTLDMLGLDIQQCVVSCFNDFAMHASCSEMQREMCCWI